MLRHTLNVAVKVSGINLPCKIERRCRLECHSLLPFGVQLPITWSTAVSGDQCPAPAWWHAGNGAWGCLMSHVRVVQDAVADGTEMLCVLEDDVCFHPRAKEMLDRMLREVPDDWDQIYLGGQHLKEPLPVPGRPFILRGVNVNRTHAFILRRRMFARYLQHILHAPDYIAHGAWHIDHQLGIAHERRDWNVYCPAWWLAGQDEGSSNISGRTNPRYWWHWRKYATGLPFIHVPCGTEVPHETAKQVHGGWNLKPGTGEDIGLDACAGNRDKLAEWLHLIAGEALDLGRLPCWQHAHISLDEVRAVWPAGANGLADADLPRLLDYPYNGLFPHPLAEQPSAATTGPLDLAALAA